MLQKLWDDESAATAIEYGLIASLIAVSVIAGATTLGTKLGLSFNLIQTKIKTS